MIRGVKFCGRSLIRRNFSAAPKLHTLEKLTNDKASAVLLRRQHLARSMPGLTQAMLDLPRDREDFDSDFFYETIHNVNCENPIGFLPMPVGVAGPLLLQPNADSAGDLKELYVPFATTEGALIASINRGMRALAKSGGVRSSVFRDGMSRAPAVTVKSASHAALLCKFLESRKTLDFLNELFGKTTSHGKLTGVKCSIAGNKVYPRFTAQTGDAMGMNMIGKGVNYIIHSMMQDPDAFDEAYTAFLEETSQGNQFVKRFADFNVDLLALSGNVCTDKKAAGINWILGRGKGVVCEAIIPEEVLKSTLAVSAKALANVHKAKNLVGSALALTTGGNNAHAANIVTALFLATGQDPAQNVESSNCLLDMDVEESDGKTQLRVSVTMPSVECGTLGGGTGIAAQKACLKMLGVSGASDVPGENARMLAQIVGASVLAGELSLNAALASDQLISAHMKLNRKETPKKEEVKVSEPKESKWDREYGNFIPQNEKNIGRREFGTSTFSDRYHEYHEQYADNRLPVP